MSIIPGLSGVAVINGGDNTSSIITTDPTVAAATVATAASLAALAETQIRAAEQGEAAMRELRVLSTQLAQGLGTDDPDTIRNDSTLTSLP